MTPEALRLWATMRAPESHWRRSARETIRTVVAAHPELLDNDAQLLAAIDRAYPFGERRMLPYKMWLLERKLFRDACTVPAATPGREDAEVCSVARDLIEIGRVDEARQLVEEQAPNPLARRCPACDAAPGKPCRDFEYDDPPIPGYGQYATGEVPIIVPHEARLVGHRDAGPLFEARS